MMHIKIISSKGKPNIWYANKINQIFKVKKIYGTRFLVGSCFYVHFHHCDLIKKEKKIKIKKTSRSKTIKISEELAKQIKNLLNKGAKQIDLAKRFNLRQGTISNIKHNKWGYYKK